MPINKRDSAGNPIIDTQTAVEYLEDAIAAGMTPRKSPKGDERPMLSPEDIQLLEKTLAALISSRPISVQTAFEQADEVLDKIGM